MKYKPNDKQKRELAAWLKQQAAERNLSLRKVGELAGLSNATVIDISNAKAENPTAETLGKLADYFKVPRETVYSMVGMLDAESDDPQLERLNYLARRITEEAPDMVDVTEKLLESMLKKKPQPQPKKNSLVVAQ